jgi:circadian clock protein KaiC
MLMGVGGSTIGPGLEKAPTGIPGLDQITGGGLPRGRVSLVAGSAGAGKTLLGLEFLVGGARKYGEPGILVSFEESAEKVALNVRSLGFDLDELEREGKLEVIAFQVDPTDMVAAGAFNLEPIFLILDDAIQRLGARRVVLDTMEMLYGAFGDDTTIRAELNRLARWLEERNVTAVVTGERGEKSVTRHGIEEYVTDCVILLDHRVTEEISTRRLRVLKYRGTVHGTNEFPFLISAQGFVVLPITSIVLDYPASDERMSTGVGRLDHMLGGGVFRGSTTLVTGVAGTGKTSLGAHMVDAACERGEQALWILFEESPAQVLRNMRSLGLDLQRWVDAGLLRIWAAQPSAFGLEAHLAALAQLMEEVAPSVVVLDGIGGLGLGVSGQEVGSMVARQIDLLKSSACTTMVTSRGREDESSTVSISSLVDTWLLLRNVETNGERNRLLFVLKSRGTAHSNQVREFVLTDHGVELVEVYVGPAGVLAGSARLAQQAVERDAELRRADDLEQHLRGLRSSISERQAHLIAARDQLIAEQTEMDRIDSRERREVADTEADRASMASQRWADATPDPDEAPGRRWARLAPDNGGKR